MMVSRLNVIMFVYMPIAVIGVTPLIILIDTFYVKINNIIKQ